MAALIIFLVWFFIGLTGYVFWTLRWGVRELSFYFKWDTVVISLSGIFAWLAGLLVEKHSDHEL